MAKRAIANARRAGRHIAMNIHIEPPRRARRTRVIALHCSGAGAGQWRSLAVTLGAGYELLAPSVTASAVSYTHLTLPTIYSV